MAKVIVTCGTCQEELYRSSDIKAPKHHENARAKAEGIARAHSDQNPDHVVELDPGMGVRPEPICPHGALEATCPQCEARIFGRVF